MLHPGSEEGLAAAHVALATALDKKALEPILLDVRGLCSYANYILILSGRSDRQVDAISEGIREGMKQTGSLLGSEGIGSGQWALMDYGDLVIHVFHHPTREHYDLEGLWIDLHRTYGFYIYAGETATFSRWLEAQLEGGIGFQARYP